jgi:hypothetical protein
MQLDGNIRNGQCENWFNTGSKTDSDIDSGFRAGELSKYEVIVSFFVSVLLVCLCV